MQPFLAVGFVFGLDGRLATTGKSKQTCIWIYSGMSEKGLQMHWEWTEASITRIFRDDK